MAFKRTICVLTGTRADYGLLYPLLRKVKQDLELELQLIVTGSHLSPEFGYTYKEIENDGFLINKKVEILSDSDRPNAISKAMGLATIGVGEALVELEPDIVVILGDRYEMLAAASAALVTKVPVAHISGGEITLGAYDDAIRHALTKLSHLHFTSTEIYRQRVIQMGEMPDTVFNVGSLSIDNIQNTDLLTRSEFETVIRRKLAQRNFLVTFHSETLADMPPKEMFNQLLVALAKFEDILLIFTYPNSDNDGRVLIEMIEDYVAKNSQRALAIPSLGRINYLSALQYVDGVIGNSSSGIVEVPAFKIGTINIGDRQGGRIRAESVIDCVANCADIVASINLLFSDKFQKRLQSVENPFGDGGTATSIKEILKSVDLSVILPKRFYDCLSETV